MFFPEGQIRVHLYGEPVDMRRSFNGLYALTRAGLKQDPLNGDLFVFISRRDPDEGAVFRSQWLLHMDEAFGGGTLHQRLAQCVYAADGLDWTGLKLLLEGIEPARQRKRYRYEQAPIASTNASTIALHAAAMR